MTDISSSKFTKR